LIGAQNSGAALYKANFVPRRATPGEAGKAAPDLFARAAVPYAMAVTRQ
jgi:hypothetical protein